MVLYRANSSLGGLRGRQLQVELLGYVDIEEEGSLAGINRAVSN